MTLAQSFRWTVPHSWPWVIWVWLGMIVVSLGYSAAKWLRRQQAESWPLADGRIEKAEAREPKPSFWKPKQKGMWEGVLEYSYSMNGEDYSGIYKRSGTQAEAVEFVRDMQSQPVAVHVNPENQSKSTLAEADVEELLKSKRPLTESELVASEEADALPRWAAPLLWPLVFLSATGLLASLVVHIGALLGRQLVPTAYFVLLHVGIFVVFIPMILVTQARFGNTQRKDFWKVAMKNAPAWMQYMVYAFFAYAIVNFALFIPQAPSGHQHSNTPPPVVWRGFSGHWMAFYSACLGVLYSAAVSCKRRCLNGHTLSAGSNYCDRCGSPPR